MTVTTTEQSPGCGTFPPEIARFASPATRLLLAADGLTTTLLEAWARAPLSVGTLDLQVTHFHSAPLLLPAAGIGPEVRVVVRRSTLVDPDGTVWSANDVVGRLDVDARVTACFQGVGPLGPELRKAGVSSHRALLETGRTPWPLAPASPAAAYRVYLLRHGDQPLGVVREVFNPAFVDARLLVEDHV